MKSRKALKGRGKWPPEAYNNHRQTHAFQDGWDVYIMMEKYHKEGKTFADALQKVATKMKYPTRNTRGLKNVLSNNNKKHISAANPRKNSKKNNRKGKKGGNLDSHTTNFHPGVINNVAKYASYDAPEANMRCSNESNAHIPERYYSYTKNGVPYYGSIN